MHPLAGNFSPETLRVGAGATYLGTNAKAVRELGISMRPSRKACVESLPGIANWPAGALDDEPDTATRLGRPPRTP